MLGEGVESSRNGSDCEGDSVTSERIWSMHRPFVLVLQANGALQTTPSELLVVRERIRS